MFTEYFYVQGDIVLGPQSPSTGLYSGTPRTLPTPMDLSLCWHTVTNINDGLMRGIEMLNKAREEHIVPERSTSIIIMLTDGDANMGEGEGGLSPR